MTALQMANATVAASAAIACGIVGAVAARNLGEPLGLALALLAVILIGRRVIP